MARFLKLFTELPLDEITRLEALRGAEINEAKKLLATEATALVHGISAAMAAAGTAKQTFEEGRAGGDLPRITLDGPTALTEVLLRASFAASRSEARRHVVGGGVRINDVVAEDPAMLVSAPAKLSFGRKRHALLQAP